MAAMINMEAFPHTQVRIGKDPKLKTRSKESNPIQTPPRHAG